MSADYDQRQFYSHLDLAPGRLTSQREQAPLTMVKQHRMNEVACRTYPSPESLSGSLGSITALWGLDPRSDRVGHAGILRSETC